jgi:MFS family permease
MDLTDNRVRLGVLTFLHFLVDFYAGVRTPLPEPTLVSHLGVGFGAVMALMGGAALLVNFIQPASGLVLRRHACPWLLLAGPLLAAVVGLLGLTSSLTGAALVLVVSSLGIGVLHPEGMLAAHSLAGSRQGLGMALYLSGGFFGFSTGGLVGGAWASRWGLSWFWLLAAPAALAAGLVVLTRLHRLADHAAGGTPAAIRHRIPFRLCWLLAVLIASGVYIVDFFITPYLYRRFGAGGQYWGGMSIFSFGLAGALGSYLWGHLSDRWGRCGLLAGCQVLSAPLLYGLTTVERAAHAPLWAAGLGLFMGGVFPLAVVLGRGAAGEGTRLRAGLLIGGSWGTASLVITGLGQWIDLHAPGAAAPVRSVLLLPWGLQALVAGLALLLWRREAPPRPAPPAPVM